MKVYLNGKFVDASQANVSVFDHGLLYGDGVFEGIRSYDGLIFKVREHIDRLFESAHTIMLKIPHTREEMLQIYREGLPERWQKRLQAYFESVAAEQTKE